MIKLVTSFTNSKGRLFVVVGILNNKMTFNRIDASADVEWCMDLKEVYRAYYELSDFSTKNFKLYVPRTHSPARGLLLHLGLLM